jgi:hypothetical protein
MPQATLGFASVIGNLKTDVVPTITIPWNETDAISFITLCNEVQADTAGASYVLTIDFEGPSEGRGSGGII